VGFVVIDGFDDLANEVFTETVEIDESSSAINAAKLQVSILILINGNTMVIFNDFT